MFTRMELGRIAGIPIYLDMMFVLMLIVFGYRYFTSGDLQVMSVGMIIIAGLLLSILLHELGHALMGRVFGIGTTRDRADRPRRRGAFLDGAAEIGSRAHTRLSGWTGGQPWSLARASALQPWAVGIGKPFLLVHSLRSPAPISG